MHISFYDQPAPRVTYNDAQRGLMVAPPRGDTLTALFQLIIESPADAIGASPPW